MPHEHILRGQLRILSVLANLSTYPATHATDGLVGITWGPFFFNSAFALF